MSQVLSPLDHLIQNVRLLDETVTSGFADNPAWGSGWKCVSELGSNGLVNQSRV
ncbi:MAG TPA: hypothetical protein V6D43_21180 [Candidatus Sericytochromatia bacterium]